VVSVEARVEGGSIVLEPRGRRSKLASLRRRVVIPLKTIERVSTPNVTAIEGLKIAGTDFHPHYGGIFYDSKKGKIFYALSNRDKCITLTLEGSGYSKVIVEVSDKEETAKMIRTALSDQKEND
jgi:hypothetical protein